MATYIENLVENKTQKIQNGENVFSVGIVRHVQQYILEVTGLDEVGFFERVVIANKAEGYVDKIDRNSIIVAITKIYEPIVVGDEVFSTGEEYKVKYSPDSLGHVIDIFGQEKLLEKNFKQYVNLEIESLNIPLLERGEVKRPLKTGISGIDLLYPIGKGQRQLIIGDKKTGKTQIALDTIVNQKNEDMICIYVAVGKTKKEVKEIYSQLATKGAMEYTVIIAAFNDECAPVLRNTPYAALSIAQWYLAQTKDVLVIIDDLKRHADVIREISLLSGKVPGRDAYPPSIFYAHSSMLEKGCQHLNGGSITILPLCETKGSDITDYISTNIISITDGQIMLSKKNFEKGFLPAIHYGLSVSRLGGAVQKGMVKKIGNGIRRELLSYLEKKEIYELANLDEMSEELKLKMLTGRKIQNALIQGKFEGKTPQQMVDDFSDLIGGEVA